MSGPLTHLDASADLEIEDQSGDGTSVRLREVHTMIPAGFVAIYDSSANLLGTAPVASSSRPVTVQLTNPIATGTCVKLYGTLWADDGDGVFDPTRDRLVVEREDDFDDHDLSDHHLKDHYGVDHAYDVVEEDFDYCAR